MEALDKILRPAVLFLLLLVVGLFGWILILARKISILKNRFVTYLHDLDVLNGSLKSENKKLREEVKRLKSKTRGARPPITL